MAMNFYIDSEKHLKRAFDMMEGKGFYQRSVDGWENPAGTIAGAKSCHDELQRKGNLRRLPESMSIFTIFGVGDPHNCVKYAVYPNGDIKVVIDTSQRLGPLIAENAQKAGFEVVNKVESVPDDED